MTMRCRADGRPRRRNHSSQSLNRTQPLDTVRYTSSRVELTGIPRSTDIRRTTWIHGYTNRLCRNWTQGSSWRLHVCRKTGDLKKPTIYPVIPVRLTPSEYATASCGRTVSGRLLQTICICRCVWPRTSHS